MPLWQYCDKLFLSIFLLQINKSIIIMWAGLWSSKKYCFVNKSDPGEVLTLQSCCLFEGGLWKNTPECCLPFSIVQQSADRETKSPQSVNGPSELWTLKWSSINHSLPAETHSNKKWGESERQLFRQTTSVAKAK